MKLSILTAALSAGMIVGVWLGLDDRPGWSPPDATIALWLAAAFVIAVLARLRGRSVFVAIVLVVAIAGLWRGDVARQLPAAPPSFRDGANVEFTGVLLTDPAPWGDRLRLVLTLPKENGIPDIPGSPAGPTRVDVLVARISDTGDFGRSVRDIRYGDRYLIKGEFTSKKVQADSDSFRFTGSPGSIGVVNRTRLQLLSADAGATHRRWLATTRARISRSLKQSLPAPVAGLAQALTVGDRSELDPEMRTAFVDSGTAHLLAISGLHVAILGAAALALAANVFGRRRQAYLLFPFLAVWGYASLAVLSEPVVRAALMISAYFVARATGRQTSPTTALFLAAAMMLWWEPQAAARAGFQLSFASVAGILIVTPRVIARSRDLRSRITLPDPLSSRLAGWAGQGLAVGVVAMTL